MAAIMIVMVKMGSCDVLQKDVVRLRLHPGHHQRHHAGRCQVPMPGSSLRDDQPLQDSQVQMQNHQPHRRSVAICKIFKRFSVTVLIMSIITIINLVSSFLPKVGAAEGAPAIQSKTASVVVQV